MFIAQKMYNTKSAFFLLPYFALFFTSFVTLTEEMFLQ